MKRIRISGAASATRWSNSGKRIPCLDRMDVGDEKPVEVR